MSAPVPTPLGRLSQFMNYRRLNGEPPVFVVEDHRAVLVCAWAAAREGRWSSDAPPTLVRLDAHPDFGEKPRPWAWERSLLADLDSAMLLANEQRCDDGGWALTAMQWGSAGGMATFGVHDYHRFPGDCGEYIDHRGGSHAMLIRGSLAAWIAEERTPHREAALREDVLSGTGPLWIDIDLDFATRRREDDTIEAWSADDWTREFPPEVVAQFGRWIERAALVTIATEPEFCGGLAGSARAAEGLKAALGPAGRIIAAL